MKTADWVYSYTETKTKTVQDVYRFEVKIPEDYEVIGFRPVQGGDTYFATYGWVDVCSGDYGDTDSQAVRLILKKKAPRRRFVFEECTKEEARLPFGQQVYWARVMSGAIRLFHATEILENAVFVRPVPEETTSAD